MELQVRLQKLQSLDVQVLAVAPDSAESLAQLADANDLDYPLLVDAGGEVIGRYGIQNLEHASGVLPDPATLVIDRAGEVRWKRIDPDYTVRPPAEEVLAAVERCCSGE